MLNSASSSELGGKPSIVNPTDAITKDKAVPFSARIHVNKTDFSESVCTTAFSGNHRLNLPILARHDDDNLAELSDNRKSQYGTQC